MSTIYPQVESMELDKEKKFSQEEVKLDTSKDTDRLMMKRNNMKNKSSMRSVLAIQWRKYLFYDIIHENFQEACNQIYLSRQLFL